MASPKDELAARFPLPVTTTEELESEATTLAAFASASPFPAPLPLGIGGPDEQYPSAWSLQSRVPGRVADPFSVAHSDPDVVG